jgi:tuberculosinol/isotuberculosinol synthase
MDLETFQSLPTEEIAQLVHKAGPKVCVFPINGTRRWFILEHPREAETGSVESYLQISGWRHIELYKLFFDHGIDTLLTPVFGPDLLEDRGEGYRPMAIQGLLWIAQDQDFLDFYDAYDVRVRIYGDVQRYFQDTPYAYVLDVFDELARRTVNHQHYRLFFGVCASDATETITKISVCFHEQNGRLPNRREIVEAYYGEYVEPADLFIGFDRPAVFDMPLVATGREDLYFTVSPSPYLDIHTLRAILYDHMYARHVNDADYALLSPENWRALADFYTLNRDHVLGLGNKHPSGSFWYPVPQVELPQRIVVDDSKDP